MALDLTQLLTPLESALRTPANSHLIQDAKPKLTMTSVEHQTSGASMASEMSILISHALEHLTRFLQDAEHEQESHRANAESSSCTTSLVTSESLSPSNLTLLLGESLDLPDQGTGQRGFTSTLEKIMKFSVNTSAPGFLDKLYAKPLPPGIAAELVLAVLNTNVHVYQVAPVLTLVEKKVTKELATLFGFHHRYAGGISVQGGSASNLTSIVVARNSLYPETQKGGNAAVQGGRLTLFTSAHGHYSIEKAAQALGLGSENVVSIGVDSSGRMQADVLEDAIIASKSAGNIPFYINATAGTTVLGSSDPFVEIGEIARRHRCWMHVDGAWGGSSIFSSRPDVRGNLHGVDKADSIAINPHKMLGVPLTCSFLLGRDMRLFQRAMTLRAGYLFHDDHERGEEITEPRTSMSEDEWTEPDDLADLTLQCGRRGDSLKFFFSWQYYGTRGYCQMVDRAYQLANDLKLLVHQHADLTSVLAAGVGQPSLQVCFHYTPGGIFPFYTARCQSVSEIHTTPLATCSEVAGRYNTMITARLAKALIPRGFMIDYAPALEGQLEKGSFFRVVINISTVPETGYRLIRELTSIGADIVREVRGRYVAHRTAEEQGSR